MPLHLPKDQYSAMMLINQLANAGHVAGVGYQVKKEKGKTILVAIRVQFGTKIEVEPPSTISMAGSGMTILGPN